MLVQFPENTRCGEVTVLWAEKFEKNKNIKHIKFVNKLKLPLRIF